MGSWVLMLEILDGFSWDDNGKRRISRGIKSKYYVLENSVDPHGFLKA